MAAGRVSWRATRKAPSARCRASSPLSCTRAHELGRDRPPRAKESASPARSAIEPRRDLHEAAKENFIRTVSDTLASELKDQKFDELVLVAPPGVIAELKHSLSKPTAKVVVRELHKDLTRVPDHALTGHLAQ
jgi:protein required for attachment to host cells